MLIQHCFPNCRCFRFKINCWSINMCCSPEIGFGNGRSFTTDKRAN